MNVTRLLAVTLVVGCMLIGWLMVGRQEPEFGRTLFLSGAIILSGLLISLAIAEKNK